MAEKKLYAVFRKHGQRKQFIDCAMAYSEDQAASFVARSNKISKDRLDAELASPEVFKRISKCKSRPKIKWQVFDENGQTLGRGTWAVSEEEAIRNVWFIRVRPDINVVSDEQKAWQKDLTAKPVFGQHVPKPGRYRRRADPKQLKLF